MWYGANWKPSTKTTGFLNGSTGVKTYYAVTCTVGDPANVWFFGAPKTPNIFFLNADQILYSRRFIRHTSPKTNMDTRNGLEKVDSFWIWPSLVSMLDFWGVSSQTWFFTPCFFSTCCRPRSWKARFGWFYLISSGRAVYVSFAGSSHFDWKWQCFLALFSKRCWFCILSIGRKAFGMLLHPLTALLWDHFY